MLTFTFRAFSIRSYLKTYNEYICQKKEKQYMSVGIITMYACIRTYIEPRGVYGVGHVVDPDRRRLCERVVVSQGSTCQTGLT